MTELSVAVGETDESLRERLDEEIYTFNALVDRPPALVPGAEWTVTINPAGIQPWGSISPVEEFNPQNGRFAYETRNADGNPSYVKWVWETTGAGTGADVTVTWDCYLKTLDRRILAGPVPKHQLAREVPRSLAALGSAVSARTGSAS